MPSEIKILISTLEKKKFSSFAFSLMKCDTQWNGVKTDEKLFSLCETPLLAKWTMAESKLESN